MPNIANVLKAEISRLARKEIRESVDAQRKLVTAQRAELSSLKRRVQTLEAAVKRLSKEQGNSGKNLAPDARSASPVSESGLRFRAQGMAANRKRLGLSAADFGLLVGATGQSVYAWEAGKTKPRGDALAAIASLRGIGKRTVDEKLAALKAS
jgi:DNA-binding transcriptional regulator YiaG